MLYFNSNLLFLMNKNNMNKNQLALKLNVSRQNVQQIVNTLNPRATTIIEISKIFNISIDDLLLKDLSSNSN